MNNFNIFDKSLIVQQQLLIHQMLLYTNMLQTQKASQAIIQSFQPQNKQENETNYSFLNKHDDTHLIQPKITKQKQKRQKKQLSNQPKKQQDVENAENELKNKKKVYLSMLDIKEAQYKKCKVIEKEKQQKTQTDPQISCLN